MSVVVSLRIPDEHEVKVRARAEADGVSLAAWLLARLDLGHMDGPAAARPPALPRKQGKGTHPTEGRCMLCVENRSQSLSSLPPCPQCPCHARVASFVVPG